MKRHFWGNRLVGALQIREILGVSPTALAKGLPSFFTALRNHETFRTIWHRFQEAETKERCDRLVADGLIDGTPGDDESAAALNSLAKG